MFATDNKKMYQVIDGALSDVGGGGQTLDNLFQLTADEPVGDWTNLDGGFSISKVNPIQGEASYVLDMTNLYSATHKVIPVDEVFRGKTLALTLNYTMTQGAARISLLDQTNTIIEGATFDLTLGSGIQKFGTTVFIPSTVTGIRFQMEARATVASQSIKFDNVELSSNLLNSANIEGDYQSETLRLNNNTFNQTTNLSSIPVVLSNSNSVIYTKSSQGITLLRDAHVKACINIANSAGAGTRDASVFVNGVIVQYNAVQANAYGVTSFVDQEFPAGTKITFAAIGGFAGQGSIQISATARSQATVFPDETFSTDINPVYWKATACGENEIGCLN